MLDLLKPEREDAEKDCLNRLDAHAADLSTTPDFKAGRSVAIRVKVAGDYLTTVTGLAVFNTMAKELEARARTTPSTAQPEPLFPTNPPAI